MYITYHLECALPSEEYNTMNHSLLHPKVQDFIKERGVTQQWYYIKSNPWRTIIYLNNGDRIDIQP